MWTTSKVSYFADDINDSFLWYLMTSEINDNQDNSTCGTGSTSDVNDTLYGSDQLVM